MPSSAGSPVALPLRAGEGLSAIEVQILHAVNHRERDKSQSELCMMFNIEDTHVVAYALKKLEVLGLVESGRRRQGKDGADHPGRSRSLPALPGSARKAAD
jgi:hypothetical protein